ncbi:relaxase domain-containing protein, partial [Serratia ureilytica]|nr:relaxase domain-containing protein [Serratia ureilytica]
MSMGYVFCRPGADGWEGMPMMSIGQVGPAGKAGDYYTHQDNYYVLGSMDERWVGQGAEALGLSGKVDVK